MLSLSTHLSCIALYAQAGAVVIGFGKMILVQVVKIGFQIFGPYCAQIDDGFFKMSRGWIQVWQSKDRQLNKLWWLADGGIDYFKCIYDLMLEAHRTTCSKMKRQEIMMGENKVTVWPSPCCLRGGEGPHSEYVWLCLSVPMQITLGVLFIVMQVSWILGYFGKFDYFIQPHSCSRIFCAHNLFSPAWYIDSYLYWDVKLVPSP